MVGDLIAVVDTLSVSSRVVSEEGGDDSTRNTVGMSTVVEGTECRLGEARVILGDIVRFVSMLRAIIASIAEPVVQDCL